MELSLDSVLACQSKLAWSAYRAPEQVDAELGLRGTHTDVWGFATCMLHLATGQLPYQGLTPWQIGSAMHKERLPDVPTTLPGWLQLAFKQCLIFDTAARTSVAQLLQVGLIRLLKCRCC